MTSSKLLFTKISSTGLLEVSLQEIELSKPTSNQVVVRIEAAPINPSDMWPMFGPAHLEKAQLNADKTVLSAPVHEKFLPRIKTRLDQTLPIGNEGAGVVMAAGDSATDQALMGKTVGVLTGSMYAEYCVEPVKVCLLHKEGVTPRQAASSFVKPLTALSMVENMHMDGLSALVHTAAASSLGQMLNRICVAQNIPLVNIVRNQAQADILKEIGATYICNSSKASFAKDLYQVIKKTGGTLASDILTAMEAVGCKDIVGFNTYGSELNKQIYVYGGLDMGPTTLNRAYAMTWNISDWLLNRFLTRLTPERMGQFKEQVAGEINTTFSSTFTDEISLQEALKPTTILKCNAKKNGGKFLINPTKSKAT